MTFWRIEPGRIPQPGERIVAGGLEFDVLEATPTRLVKLVIREAPDWLSVKIGINDLHSYLWDRENGVSPRKLSNVKFILDDLSTNPRKNESPGCKC